MKIMHIRKRLRPAKGNQFYKDYSDRGQGTYCGSEYTSYDLAWKDSKTEKRISGFEIDGRKVCQICKKLRMEENNKGEKK